ncbi:transposase IS200-family protein [Calothrix sp. PCC 7716]|nr:transposase IS200-family protein [Calothrix sp. PCC 7716]
MASFDPDEYRHEGNAVCLLNYHFVWIPSSQEESIGRGHSSQATRNYCYSMYRKQMENYSNGNYAFLHVHLFLNVRVIDAPADIMRKIKGRASHHLRQEFPELLKIPTLWTPSYFVSTAGN